LLDGAKQITGLGSAASARRESERSDGDQRKQSVQFVHEISPLWIVLYSVI
jgi:hypothetical protein